MAFIASPAQFVTLGEGEERRGVVAPGDRFRAKELPSQQMTLKQAT